MKNKRLLTVLLSLLATASVATGVAVTAMANDGAFAPVPVETDNGNKAYFVGKEDSTVEYGTDNNSTKKGIKANLALDDKLTIKNVIDLQKCYDENKSFIEIQPVVREEGKADYTHVVLEIIDVYDESNYLKVQINPTPQMEDESTTSYFLACASNGQKLSGYESGRDILYVNSVYGEWAVFAFGDVIGGSSGTGFFYDVEKKAISAVNYAGVRRQIIDFDDPKFFGTNLWDGFTSNEVYCRISCTDYKGDTAGILVTQYGDYDLSNPEIYDVVAPALTVDYGEYAKDSVPSALVGKNYSIFPTTTFDAVDGWMEADVKVYMNYYSSSKKEVSVSKNGTFKPSIPVPHHIVYSATDSRGNTVEEIVPINVLASIDDLTLSFDEVPLSCVEGNKYVFPAYTVNGALGNPKVSVSVTLNGKALDMEDGGVRPYTAGEMKVSYQVEDYVGRTYETEHTVTVTEAQAPTFIETPVLTKYLIAGNEYVFPTLNAYDYMQGEGEAIATTIHVVENGAEKAVADNTYTVADGIETASVIYRAQIGSTINEYVKEIPVYSVRTDGDLDMAKYFVHGANGATATDSRSVDLTATGDESFAFINRLTALLIKTEFTLCDTPKNMEKLHIVLTDAADESKQIQFTYTFTGSASTFYVNGNEAGAMTVEGALVGEKMFSLSFDAANKKVFYDVSTSNVLAVNTFLNGEAFNGFTGNKAYISYVFEGVKDSVSLSVNSLNGNYFSDEIDDWISPYIDLIGSVGGEYQINDVMTLPTALANDVLAGDLKAYVTLKTPSGAIAKTTDGRSLENLYCDGSVIQVKLTEYGSYIMEFTAADAAGNEAYSNTLVWVVDTDMPTLSLSGELPKTAKVGDKIKVPKATATDNLTQNVSVRIYAITANGSVLDVSNADGFVASEAGTYTVVYMVSDEAGNYDYEYRYITVRK